MENLAAENHFETVYQEYKNYKSYIDSTEVEVEKRKQDFAKYAIESGESIDTLIDKMFELEIKPLQSRVDLKNAKERLIYTFEALQDVLDFPQEVRSEIKQLEKSKPYYTIKNGVQIEIDVEANSKARANIKAQHLEILKQLKTNPLA